MVAVDRPSPVVQPVAVTPTIQTQQAEPAVKPVLVAEANLPAELAPADQNTAQTPANATFDPAAAVSFKDTQPPALSATQPIKGVLKDEALQERLSTLETALSKGLMNATYKREILEESMQYAGPHLPEALEQQTEAFNKAEHAVKSMSELLTVMKSDGGVEALQEHLQETAINEATGSEIEADGVYGPKSDEILRQRIQNPDATYVSPDDVFVYQEGEIGVDGGTRMEAQANCGPASMAMVIERQGGEAPTMKELRQDVGAPTGNRNMTYGLDANQVMSGITDTLAEQGINVTTELQEFSSKQSAEVLNAMREKLAAGDDVILLTSNMGSGGSTGHYVVVNEVKADGTLVLHDPQEPDGADTEQTLADLEAAMSRRAGEGRSTSVISIRAVD